MTDLGDCGCVYFTEKSENSVIPLVISLRKMPALTKILVHFGKPEQQQRRRPIHPKTELLAKGALSPRGVRLLPSGLGQNSWQQGPARM